MVTKGIIYYSDSQLDEKIAKPVRDSIRAVRLPIVSCTLKPLEFGDNIVLEGKRGYYTMFRQILTALEALNTDVVFFTEHDVIYPKEHFDFIPEDNSKFYYDLNWWKVRKDGLAVHWDAVQVSGLCCYRDLALKFYREKIATFDSNTFDRKFEPTVDTEYETWWGDKPLIDIRHEHNLTYNKWKLDHFRKKETAVNFISTTVDKIPGWHNLRDVLQFD